MLIKLTTLDIVYCACTQSIVTVVFLQPIPMKASAALSAWHIVDL